MAKAPRVGAARDGVGGRRGGNAVGGVVVEVARRHVAHGGRALSHLEGRRGGEGGGREVGLRAGGGQRHGVDVGTRGLAGRDRQDDGVDAGRQLDLKAQHAPVVEALRLGLGAPEVGRGEGHVGGGGRAVRAGVDGERQGSRRTARVLRGVADVQGVGPGLGHLEGVGDGVARVVAVVGVAGAGVARAQPELVEDLVGARCLGDEPPFNVALLDGGRGVARGERQRLVLGLKQDLRDDRARRLDHHDTVIDVLDGHGDDLADRFAAVGGGDGERVAVGARCGRLEVGRRDEGERARGGVDLEQRAVSALGDGVGDRVAVEVARGHDADVGGVLGDREGRVAGDLGGGEAHRDAAVGQRHRVDVRSRGGGLPDGDDVRAVALRDGDREGQGLPDVEVAGPAVLRLPLLHAGHEDRHRAVAVGRDPQRHVVRAGRNARGDLEAQLVTGGAVDVEVALAGVVRTQAVVVVLRQAGVVVLGGRGVVGQPEAVEPVLLLILGPRPRQAVGAGAGGGAEDRQSFALDEEGLDGHGLNSLLTRTRSEPNAADRSASPVAERRPGYWEDRWEETPRLRRGRRAGADRQTRPSDASWA